MRTQVGLGSTITKYFRRGVANPSGIGNSLGFWTNVDAQNSDNYNTSNHQLNNVVEELPDDEFHIGLDSNAGGYLTAPITNPFVPGDYEFGAWINYNNLGTGLKFILETQDANGGIRIGINNSRAYISHREPSGTLNAVSPVATISANTWYYLHAYYVGGTLNAQFYNEDGTVVGTPVPIDIPGEPISVSGETTLGLFANNIGTASTKSDVIIKDMIFFTGHSELKLDGPPTQAEYEAFASDNDVYFRFPFNNFSEGTTTSGGETISDTGPNGNDATVVSILDSVYTSAIGLTSTAANGGTAPDVQVNTGGYLSVTSAGNDGITIPDITLTGQYTFHLKGRRASSFFRVGSSQDQIVVASGFFNFEIDNVNVISSYSDTFGTSWFTVDLVVDTVSEIITYYRDGVFVEDIDISGAPAFGDMIVQSIISSGNADGDISEFALFNSALDSSQITALYKNPDTFDILCRSYSAECCYTFSEGRIASTLMVVQDLSGNGNHGWVNAGSTIASGNDQRRGLQTAMRGFSYYTNFDGSNDYIRSDKSGLDFSTDIRIEVKLILTSGSGARNILGAGNNDDLFYIGAGNVPIVRLGGSGATNSYSFSTIPLTTGKLHTLVFEWDASENSLTMTLDGVSEVATGLTGTVNWSGTLDIGTARGATAFFFQGMIGYLKYTQDGTDELEYVGRSPWTNLVTDVDGTINGSPVELRMLTESPTDTEDLFGNDTQYKWVKGIFNLGGGDHGAMVLDSGSNSHFSPEASWGFLFKYTGDGKALFQDNNAANGVRFDFDSGDFRFINYTNGGVTNSAKSSSALTLDAWYISTVTVESDGRTSIYIGTVSSAMALDGSKTNNNSPEESTNDGAIGELITSTGFEYDDRMNMAKWNGVLTLDQIEDFRTYCLTLINKL